MTHVHETGPHPVSAAFRDARHGAVLLYNGEYWVTVDGTASWKRAGADIHPGCRSNVLDATEEEFRPRVVTAKDGGVFTVHNLDLDAAMGLRPRGKVAARALDLRFNRLETFVTDDDDNVSRALFTEDRRLVELGSALVLGPTTVLAARRKDVEVLDRATGNRVKRISMPPQEIDRYDSCSFQAKDGGAVVAVCSGGTRHLFEFAVPGVRASPVPPAPSFRLASKPAGALHSRSFDASHALAWGRTLAQLWRTLDGGRTWSRVPVPVDGDPAAVFNDWEVFADWKPFEECTAARCYAGGVVVFGWGELRPGRPVLAALRGASQVARAK